MTELERVDNVIKAVQLCDGYCDEDTGCPYDSFDAFDCQKELKKDIAELLNMLKPHLLTLEEVNKLPACHVVIELNKRNGFLHWIDALLFCRNIDGSIEFITLNGKVRFPSEEYGKTWRCWDRYISDAQCEGVKWE